MNQRIAILILNHVQDRHLYRLYQELKDDCGAMADVWLLSDRTRRQLWQPRPSGVSEYRFTVSDLLGLPYPGKRKISVAGTPVRNMSLGNAELPVILFAQQHTNYDRFWIVEYDARFSGSWSTFFSYFEDSEAALLGTTLTPYPDCEQWSHWPSISATRLGSSDEWVRGFFPVYRISRDAIDCLHAEYQLDTYGHMEGLMPSLIKSHGLTLQDFGGSGPYVAPCDINRFYTNTPTDNSYSPGTFVFRPVMEAMGEQRDTLWHPVKPPISFVTKTARFLMRKVPK